MPMSKISLLDHMKYSMLKNFVGFDGLCDMMRLIYFLFHVVVFNFIIIVFILIADK